MVFPHLMRQRQITSLVALVIGGSVLAQQGPLGFAQDTSARLDDRAQRLVDRVERQLESKDYTVNRLEGTVQYRFFGQANVDVIFTKKPDGTRAWIGATDEYGAIWITQINERFYGVAGQDGAQRKELLSGDLVLQIEELMHNYAN